MYNDARTATVYVARLAGIRVHDSGAFQLARDTMLPPLSLGDRMRAIELQLRPWPPLNDEDTALVARYHAIEGARSELCRGDWCAFEWRWSPMLADFVREIALEQPPKRA
jgi:hypothetical protein